MKNVEPRFISSIFKQKSKSLLHNTIHLSMVGYLVVSPADGELPGHLAARMPQGLVPKPTVARVLPWIGATLLVPVLAGSGKNNAI